MFRDGLRDRSTEDGWETIGAIIDEDELDFGISSAQGVDFYKEAFDLSVRTDSVIWPSSEGGAAFVMACPPGSEDGDLAVYKIDGGLIGDDEITVDDIERLGGTRMLCVYKHGPDGIEGIRDFANRMAIHRFRERVTVRDPFGDLPDLAPALRNAAAQARAAVQQPRDPQGIAAAALTAAEGGTKARHLRSPELQHRSVMLRTEKARRLHESRSREMEKGAATRRPCRRGLEAASEHGGGTVEHGGNKHQ